MVAADQADREDELPADLADRDRPRLQRVRQILTQTSAAALDSDDLFAAALVCQHGPDVEDLERARHLACKRRISATTRTPATSPPPPPIGC